MYVDIRRENSLSKCRLSHNQIKYRRIVQWALALSRGWSGGEPENNITDGLLKHSEICFLAR